MTVKTKHIYGKINIPERELYDHINSSWTQKAKGTIPKDQRFIKGNVAIYYAKLTAKTLMHSIVISYDGKYKTISSELTPKQFDKVINNVTLQSE